MPKILYISNKLARRIGGREQLSYLHQACLSEIFGRDVTFLYLPSPDTVGLRNRLSAAAGYIDGITAEKIDATLNFVVSNEVDIVYFNGSNLGLLAKKIRERVPRIRILTFCHNVETRFFWGSFRTNWKLRTLAVVLANYIAERNAIKASDELICLNQRDSALFKQLFGREATHILPMAIRDSFVEQRVPECASDEKYLLFVGADFYANLRGIEWFARNVAPKLPVTTCVVGRGMGNHRTSLERFKNVKIIGEVDDLASWYLNALLVVAPIFDGSGMKTKVAEAMMYGKKTVGTDEAFVGYEEYERLVGWRCGSAKEFVTVLLENIDSDVPACDADVRKCFLVTYSPSALKNSLKQVFDANGCHT